MATHLQTWRELRHGDALLRALRGRLDESFRPEFVDASGCTHLVLDLAHVTHVSSFGVRDWIRAVRDVRGSIEGLYYIRCSARVTDQFNMVMGFDGGGSLLSFYAYYVCDSCGEQTAILLDTKLDRNSFESLDAPTRQCLVCGSNAELDDDPSVAFEYVRSSEAVVPPSSVLSLLRGTDSWISDVPGARLTVRQSLEADATRFALAGVIDSSFSPRRFSAADTRRVFLALGQVRQFEPTGFDAWRAMVSALTEKTNLRLIECPPMVLRRFVDDPSLIGNATIDSVDLPVRCYKCHRRVVTALAASRIEAALAKPPMCPQCSEPLDISTLAGHWRAFSAAVTAERRAPAPAAPTTRGSAPATAKPAKQPRTGASLEDSFVEKYEVLCKLAEGGMAEVFLVRQRGPMGFRRLAVVKRVRSELLTDDRMMRLFLDEAKLAARLDHPNIIRVYDLGRSEGSLHMVLEFVHGRSLSEIMRELVSRGRTVPPRLAADIGADLSRGLARAHAPDTSGRVLVHRDVTPNNVLVSFDGTVKLVDFGLAGYQKSKWEAHTVLGSPPWVAPEIFMGQDASPQTDIWGVGLLVQAMLTGTVPFRRATVEATARAVLHEKIKRPWFRSKVPRRLFRIIEQCIDKTPEQRYQDATVLESELRHTAVKLKGESDLGAWMSELFAHEIRFENEFFRRGGASSFVDALHSAHPEQISRFFRLRATQRGTP